VFPVSTRIPRHPSGGHARANLVEQRNLHEDARIVEGFGVTRGYHIPRRTPLLGQIEAARFSFVVPVPRRFPVVRFDDQRSMVVRTIRHPLPGEPAVQARRSRPEHPWSQPPTPAQYPAGGSLGRSRCRRPMIFCQGISWWPSLYSSLTLPAASP
jgi:hypothetical protein